MVKKIIQLVAGKDCELRESMFRAIIMFGGFATFVAIAEILLVMEINSLLVAFLVLLLLAMGGSFFVTFRYRKLDIAAIIMAFVIVVIVFPVMFLLSGGIDSGAAVWFALGIFYIFMMFSGKKMVFFLVLSFISFGITYCLAYQFPELVVPMPSREAVYFDSFFSLFVVGAVAGGILKVHMRLFEAEHRLNLIQKEALERTSNTKNVFFANMSHEIRTPINAIIGLNEMILRTNPEGETREYAKDIQMASKMLLNQINDILDLSQMEMQKMKIVPVQYRTDVLVGDLIDLVRVQLEKKGLQFYLDIDSNLPSVLLGDEKRIKQVLLNILDNAVKYTEAGSVTLSVRGETQIDGEITLEIKVADTGIGIRKEDIAYLYDSFNRVEDRHNSRIMGSGLGLAITKQLVDLMEGEITVDSIYTKGTIFTVLLKQKIIDGQPIGMLDSQKKTIKEDVFYKPAFEAPEARVLLVDDNRMNSRVASRLLSDTKVQIDIAGSGAECLEMTKKKYYHIILMDYMMPDMNGEETLKAIRSQENGLCRESAVIVLTGNTLSGAKELYLEQGFDGFVEKPIQGKLLEAEILQFLPADIIEYQENEGILAENNNQIQRITRKKRKKIAITADCVCDVPTELLEKYGIKLMYLYIKTPHGRFADTTEIDSDSFRQYLSADSSSAYADSVTIEEYEEFFAETLTEAERVIHISLTARAGRSYNLAVESAKGFDHVHIIDSGQISAGQALVVLYAAKLAMEGKNADEIIDAVEKMKGNVQTRFVLPGAEIFYQNGRTRKLTLKVCKMLNFHPYVAVRRKKVIFVGLLCGKLEQAWKQAIRWHLRRKRKINTDVVFITHVGCSVKQLEYVKSEVLKCVPFEKVYINKASFSNACNAGMHTIGIAYYRR